eukprot:g9325.t1
MPPGMSFFLGGAASRKKNAGDAEDVAEQSKTNSTNVRHHGAEVFRHDSEHLFNHGSMSNQRLFQKFHTNSGDLNSWHRFQTATLKQEREDRDAGELQREIRAYVEGKYGGELWNSELIHRGPPGGDTALHIPEQTLPSRRMQEAGAISHQLQSDAGHLHDQHRDHHLVGETRQRGKKSFYRVLFEQKHEELLDLETRNEIEPQELEQEILAKHADHYGELTDEVTGLSGGAAPSSPTRIASITDSRYEFNKVNAGRLHAGTAMVTAKPLRQTSTDGEVDDQAKSRTTNDEKSSVYTSSYNEGSASVLRKKKMQAFGSTRVPCVESHPSHRAATTVAAALKNKSATLGSNTAHHTNHHSVFHLRGYDVMNTHRALAD